MRQTANTIRSIYVLAMIYVGGLVHAQDSPETLVATYPYGGGPVTIQPADLDTALSLKGLEFTSFLHNSVIGGDPTPFATVVENSPTHWHVSSAAEIVVDGPIVLDLHVRRPLNPAIHDSPRIIGRHFSDLSGDGDFEVQQLPAPETDLLKGSYSHQGPVVLETTKGPVALREIDLLGVNILTDGNPAPFDTLVHNGQDGRWTAASASNVVLDGSIQLDAVVSDRSSWTFNAWMRDETGTPFSIPMTKRQPVFATANYPEGGGPIRVFSQTPVTSVTIEDLSGTLQSGNTAGLFETVTSNSKSLWAAESSLPVTLQESRGTTLLDVVASENIDATATFSNGLDSIVYPIHPARDPVPDADIIGRYPFEGGPILLKSTKGPLSLNGLSIEARAGELIGTTNARPFENVLTNTSTEWIVESTNEVLLDGTIQLDLNAAPAAQLFGDAMSDGEAIPIVFNGLAPRLYDDEQPGWKGPIGVYPEEGGSVWLLTPRGPIVASGIDLKTTQPVLSNGDNPAPFAFYLIGNNQAGMRQVVLGSLGGAPTIDGALELEDVFVAPNIHSDDFTAVWSDGGHASFQIVAMPYVEQPVPCSVPEGGILGDLDGNGSVDFGDFLTLSSNYQKRVFTYDQGDIDCDGDVLFDDFLWLGSNFGKTAEAAVVPEPDSTGWLAFGATLLGVAISRRRRYTLMAFCPG